MNYFDRYFSRFFIRIKSNEIKGTQMQICESPYIFVYV